MNKQEGLLVGGIELEVLRRGSGRPILLLHGLAPVDPNAPFLDGLAEYGEVIAPSHPGFGGSAQPEHMDSMYDLVHVYLSVLDKIDSDEVVVVGLSFGGWIAAELAAHGHKSLSKLVLVNPFGIKVGGPEDRDIVHLFNTSPQELRQRAWHSPTSWPAAGYGLGWQTAIDESTSDEDMIMLARGWDALCIYGWSPHMYNPHLKHWLHRVAIPTAVIWGESDQIVTPEYGRSFSELIPGSRFEVIEAAGHHPDLEQPEQLVNHIAKFIN